MTLCNFVSKNKDSIKRADILGHMKSKSRRLNGSWCRKLRCSGALKSSRNGSIRMLSKAEKVIITVNNIVRLKYEPSGNLQTSSLLNLFCMNLNVYQIHKKETILLSQSDTRIV
jgi:hypothetical protein